MIGVTGVAVALALGGAGLLLILHIVLIQSVDSGARQTADDVAELINEGELADPVPTAGSQYVQVLDAQSRIRAASIGADRLTPLLSPAELAQARRGEVLTVPGDRLGLSGVLRVVTVSAGFNDGARTVLVAGSARDAGQSIETVRDGFLVAYPLLLTGLGLLAWRVVGWTLRPVEHLRAGAEEISASQGGRLPLPFGDDEVHRLAVTLNRMLDRLEAGRYRQRAFVADAAHELRSPIASLRTQLEVADHLGEPAPTADLAAEVARLSRLVDDLLLLARVDEGDPALRRREPVELVGVLGEAAAACAGARVEIVVTPGSPQWTPGDPVGLRRMVDNLLSNAVRHASRTVTMSATRAGERILVTVADDGPGIPTADRARVFDRFTRLDDARARDSGGTGLGLAIVQELARTHGGSVTLADAAPGLRATLNLPATAPPT
jgi:signal transduction histidine kinase